jgi:hypothetical protein
MLCPNGHEVVTEDQDAGRKIPCPHCKLVVTVPDPQAAITSQPAPPESRPPKAPDKIDSSEFEEENLPPLEAVEEERRRPRRPTWGPERNDDDEDEEEDRPRKKKKKKRTKGSVSRQQLAMTSRGLGFHHAKLLTYLIALPVVIVCNLAATFVFASGARDLVACFAVVGLVASACYGFVSPALGIIGSALCCSLPSRTGGRPLIIKSLLLDVTALIFPLVSILGAASPAFSGFGTATAATVLALVLFTTAFLWTGASLILFVLFLRRLANLLDDAGMAGMAGMAGEAREIPVHYLLLLIAAPIIVGAAIFLLLYLGQDYASAFDFACAVFAPQAGLVESREWVIGSTFATVLGIWLVFVIKLLFRMLSLIGSLRYKLRARYGV